MKETFKKIITDFHDQPIKDRIRRDIEIPLDSGKIVSLIGVRRSGKTSILFHFINRLKTEVDPARIVYINFEDDRLFPLKLHQLDDLVQAYFELHPTKRKEKIYLFFDEIQQHLEIPCGKNSEIPKKSMLWTTDLSLFLTCPCHPTSADSMKTLLFCT